MNNMQRIELGAGHVYRYVGDYVDKEREVRFVSVSDLKKSLQPVFEESVHALVNAGRMGITEGVVLRRWGISRDIGTSYGSMIDGIVMACLESIDYKELVRPIPFLYDVARSWMDYYVEHLLPLEVEDCYGQCVVGKEVGVDRFGLSYGIAGTSDIFVVGSDWFRVIDVKTDGAILRQGSNDVRPGYAYRDVDGVVKTRGLEFENKYGKSLLGIYDVNGGLIADCNYNIYAFQVTMYGMLATTLGGFWHNGEFVSLAGKRYVGGGIAHYDGVSGLFNHYAVSRNDWWLPVSKYLKAWKEAQ